MDEKIGRSNSIFAVEELRHLYPHVEWRLVAIDADYNEAINCRNISYAAAPAKTVMDFNIAIAIWFAARGYGMLQHNPSVALPHAEKKKVSSIMYESKARIVLTGVVRASY